MPKQYIFNEGPIYSTSYHIVYESPEGEDSSEGIEQKMMELDYSLSTFNAESTISKVNRNLDPRVDSLFKKCFRKGMKISKKTDGAFDMTIAPLVNAWGFGFKDKETITPALINNLLENVGFQKVKLLWNRVVKKNPDVMLDASAIAKGLAVDIVAKYLTSKGCRNYMVEIGGEVAARGVNQHYRIWRVGITKPVDDQTFSNQDLQDVVALSGKALATSGNYRNYYIEGDKKYSHTINPRNGYPVQHSLLSATVLADDCMTADAYATAFLVLGTEKSMKIIDKIRGLEGYFIYSDDEGQLRVTYSKGFEKYLVD
jgi:thiamine biosynthesis lipoprotein